MTKNYNLNANEDFGIFLTSRVVYPAVMTVSCRHVVSCCDGPLRHDTIGST
jgi:hypothetical protein